MGNAMPGSELNEPRLVVTGPEELVGLVLALSAPQMVIGHSETADLILADRFVSRRHALVTVDASGTVTIRDLNSTGGTFVNEERLDGARVLSQGDTVRFADLVARFEPGSGPAPAAAVPAAAATRPLPVLTGERPATGTATTGAAGSGAGAASGTAAGPASGTAAGPASGQQGAAAGTTYSVTGTALSPALPGVGGLSVQLVDKNVGRDQVLASTQTAGDGSYSFSKSISARYLADHHKASPDLQVQVLAGGSVLAASQVSYSAPETVSLDVVLPAGATGLPSEYETLTANLAALYPGRLGKLQENATQQDITYLANKTGWDARAVALAALADQFSQITAPTRTTATAADPAQTAAWPVPAVSIQPEFYYALFRAGLPARTDGLFQASPATVKAVWEQAVSGGVIPAALAKEVPAATASFQTISASRSLDAAPPAGLSTLREMITSTGLLSETTQQDQFAQLYAQYQGDWPSFWREVGQAFGSTTATQLQLGGQLLYLTVNNAPLVSALRTAENDSPLTSALDLATRGYYEPGKWAPLIGASVPPEIPGSDADEQAANYAQLLAAQVRIAYPTAVAGDQVRRNILPVPGPAKVADTVASFLTENQAGFVIGAEPVQAYIARMGLTQTDPTVVSAIKRIQRVYQLTPDDASTSVLLFHNLDSAFAITRYDSAGFVRAFAGQLGGEDKAAVIHTRAKQVFASTLSVTVAYLAAKVTPSLGGRVPIQYGFPPQSAPPDFPVTAYPTLEELFGSLDYCNCDDCGSILSPAAYLVDLLNYIDQPAPTAGGSNPLDVLLARRPDLQYLPLTCANTNTALPYIDIVNEVLEYFVANRLQISGYQGHDTGDSVTSAELVASPQYVNDAAYGLLQNAFFPPPLPYNRPLELLRFHLASLGVSLPAAMAALRPNDNLANTATPTSYGWTDILLEQLTISRDEYRLFTDPTLQLSDLYGLPDAAGALGTLQTTSLQDFSRRLGVSYDDLTSIIQTQFINPNAALIPRLEMLNAPFTTLQALQANLNTPQSIAADFIAALPAGLDATQYGGADPADYQAVVDWVTSAQNYQKIMSIIVISEPGGTADDCSGALLQFRYANPDNAANMLSGTDFLKLIRFIRLWEKLAPILGDQDDSVTIAQTDNILTALYPAADTLVDPGDSANDATNRPLLDAGFAALLPRAGFLFQVLNSLSLDADAGLDQLLACWAPIGTVGANSLYQNMFLTPALLQQDPGAQTATVASTVNAGDVLSTWVNGVQEIPAYTVSPGQTAAQVAAAIAASVNTSGSPDPVSGLPLSSRFHASTNGDSGVITIVAGFDLQCSASPGASETYTATAGTPVSCSATVAGPVTTGDLLITTIDTVQVQYQVVAGDTAETIAAGIAAAVNATTVADPYSGLPLNGLVVADAATGSAVVTFTAADAGAPFTLACSLDPGNEGTYTAAPPVPASCTATIGGTAAAGDVLVTTVNSVPVSYTTTSANPVTIAVGIAAAINAAVATDPLTSLPLNEEVQATSSGGVITIAAIDPMTPVTLTCQVTTGSVTYTAAGPSAETATVTVAGTIPAATTLTTTINALPLSYLTTPADTPSTIAAAIANSINTTGTADLVTSLPLNSVVRATTAGGVLTLTGLSPTTPFTLEVAMSAAGYTAGQARAPFADNGYGDFLTDTAQTIFGHEPTLCAACNLSNADFALITSALGWDSSTGLTLDNVSALFRYGWLAHALNLSVAEFLLLREWSGLNPFAPLDPGTSAPAEPPVIRFIALLTLIQAAGLTTNQALYLMWNQDVTGTSAPPLTTVTGLALALAADFAAVAAQFTLQVDPDGSIAQNLMTLVYGATASAFFFGLLNNTFTTSFGYSTPTDQALPAQVIAASSGRLSYDDLAKQLTFAGVLDQGTQTDIDAAVQASGFDVPKLTAAIAGLASANQQAIGPFFSTYPELLPLYTAFVASSDPVQDKRTALLASFLPVLELKRKQEQALAAISSAAGTDPSFATALLQDPTILHADADVTRAAIGDLVAIENQGLSASFYLGNDLSGAPDQVVDSVPVLSYAQTATIGGTITNGDVLTTAINGVAVAYTVGSAATADISLAVLAGNVAAAINAATAADPVTGLPLNQVVTASVLPASQGGAGNVIAIAGLNPSAASGFFTLATTVSSGATEVYSAASQLPAGTGSGDIAAVWSGYLTVPQDGFYDINVAADPGSTIAVELGGVPVPPLGPQPGGLWSNQGPISLTAGSLVPITLTATSIKTTFCVSWQSQGMGWQPVPTQYLYPANLVTRLGDTYVRFLKASSLASDLSLTATEIAYLGTATGFSVNTTGATLVTPGTAAFTPLSMANIAVGSVLVIDDGSAQETVTVTAVNPPANPTSFTAVAAKAHDGTGTPFAIVSRSFPAIGQGWLNFLSGSGWLAGAAQAAGPDPATAAELAGVLTALADFAVMKQALSPADGRLLAVLQNPAAQLPVSPVAAQSPAATLPATKSALLSLTGWNLASVNALLTQFFGSTSPARLTSVENLRRVYDAYAIVTGCGLAGSALISAITNAPTPMTVSALQSALRAQYAPADWLTIIGPINNQARIAQRDALVAYILQQLGDDYAASLIDLSTTAAAGTGSNQLTFAVTTEVAEGMSVQGAAIAPGTVVTGVTTTTVTLSTGTTAALPSGSTLTFVPADATAVVTADDLYQYFLIDTQNQPPVLTSRILLALSTVQLFIERVVRNLEPQVSAADIDSSMWTWMKRYRVWQANREVFLWPENWLYPELRDDQSPFFQQMMSNLLQGDITDDAAATAYLTYLTNLEEVAKLEQCGMYYLPASADADETTYVVARTAGAHRKYYFRELTSGSWTPWTEVQIECEDMPVTPIVWNGRLFLFWLKVTKQTSPGKPTLLPAPAANSNQDLASMPVGDLNSFITTATGVSGKACVTVQAVLYWAEFYNGQWQTTKTSDANLPTVINIFDPSGDGSFESCRNLFSIVPAQPQSASYLSTEYGIQFALPQDALLLAITGSTGANCPGFILHNTHSLPVRFDDITLRYFRKVTIDGFPHFFSGNLQMASLLDQPSLSRSFQPGISPPYTGNYQPGGFTIGYAASTGGTPASPGTLFQYSWQPRWVEPQPWLADPWGAPFIYEDRRHLFYVVPTEHWTPIWRTEGFGVPGRIATTKAPAATIPPLILRQQVVTPTPAQFLAVSASAGDPAAVQRYIAQDTGLNAALPIQQAISYQGQVITPVGGLAAVLPSPGTDQAGD
jgi:Neuraminidase-like domain/FHA domain/Salmonella virulence plasmid 28.1kDa A protein